MSWLSDFLGTGPRTTGTDTFQQQQGSQWNLQNQNQTSLGGFNQNQMLDPNSQSYVDWMRGLGQQNASAAMGVNTPGANPYMMQAINNVFGGGGNAAAGLGNVSAAMGNLMSPQTLQNDISTYMNPYLQGVVDPTRAEFDVLRGQTRKATTQAALAGGAGAYGSARHGVLEGTRLGELDRAQTSQIANLMSGGYDTALQAAMQDRAQRAAGLGSLGGAYSAMGEQDLRRQELGFNMANQLWGIQNQQSMDAIRRGEAAMGFANQGLGPTGWTNTGTNFNNQQSSGSNYGGSSGTQTGSSTSTDRAGGNNIGQYLGAAGTLWDMFDRWKNPGGQQYMPGGYPSTGGGYPRGFSY